MLAKQFFRIRFLKIIITTLLLIGIVFFLFFQFIMKGEPYQFTLRYIQSNNVVSEKLGVVKKTKLSFFSSLSYRGPRGIAHYKIYVTGEKGQGIVYIDMEKTTGEWHIVKANLVLSDNSLLNLENEKPLGSPI